MGTVALEVLKPTGLARKERKIFEADRFDALDGKRIGLVWNHKDYGDTLLDLVEELFAEKYPKVQISRWQLQECCIAPPKGELENIAKQVDGVVYTLGD